MREKASNAIVDTRCFPCMKKGDKYEEKTGKFKEVGDRIQFEVGWAFTWKEL